MDATLLWTAVGSGATAAGVVATVVIYRLQARAGRTPIQVELVRPGGTRAAPGSPPAAGPARGTTAPGGAAEAGGRTAASREGRPAAAGAAGQRTSAGRDSLVASGNQYIGNYYPARPAADGTGAPASPVPGSGPGGSTVLRAPTGRLPRHVRGRDELLERLTGLLTAPDGRVHVLAGLGGTGKSTVALALAEEAAERGMPAWWVPAVDTETMTARLLELAEDLGAPPGEVAQARAGQRNPADLLWRYLGQCGPWLLIFDNADDPAVLSVGDADAASGAGWLRPVHQPLPRVPGASPAPSSGLGTPGPGTPGASNPGAGVAGGLIVVTSRNREALAWGWHAELHPVGWLDAADGGWTLTDLAPQAGTPGDAAALAERLGGLPVALHHAGSQLASEFAAERTFTGYLRSLNNRFPKLMGGGHPVAGHGAARHDDRAIVTSTWELSLDALAAGGRPQARPILRVLCCLAPAVLIPDALLDVAVLARLCDEDADRAADGLRALASVGLITTSHGPDGAWLGVTVHPLVSETSLLRLGAEDPARTGGTAVALLAAAARRLDAERPADWPAWLRLVPHLNAVYASVAAELADGDLATLARVTQPASLAFTWTGQYAADLELAQAALFYVDRLGADHEATLRLRHRIASAHFYLGQYEQAEHDYHQVLDARTRVLGPDHPETLLARYEIARVTAEQGRPEQAEHDYRQVLDAQTRALGPDHHGTLATRYEIARMAAEQGRYEQAEHDYRQVLDAQTRARGPDHPNTLATRYEIARMAAEQGRYEQAEHDYRQVLDAQTRVLGPDHPDTLTTRHGMAVALHTLGKAPEARREFLAVLEAQTRVLGPDHPSTRLTASWIG